ncbi:MAG: hypothetical protein DRJ35_07190 [Thermoprotei archaeon]|nr:MAG: hypothetical protein DRJ35_07190 [Thermoprotei archaeon]
MPTSLSRLGSVLIFAGILLLLITFFLAYVEYSSINISGDLTSALNSLIWAVVKAIFLGIMGWIGSILVARGLEAFGEEKTKQAEGW